MNKVRKYALHREGMKFKMELSTRDNTASEEDMMLEAQLASEAPNLLLALEALFEECSNGNPSYRTIRNADEAILRAKGVK